MDRRKLLKSTAAAATTLAAGMASGPRIFAQPAPALSRDRQLADIARREIDRAGASLWHRDVIGIADFGLHSAQERFHFVDLARGKVDSFLVTHGDGSDTEHDGWLKRYSNVEGSHCTSQGAYMTRGWYVGRFGTSIRLDGLDPTNSNALPRAIVMHQADYATPGHVERYGRLGRSNGCLAMGPEQFDMALIRLAGGRMIYADSLGIAADGSKVVSPSSHLALLRRDPPEGTFDRTNPGVF